MTRRVALAAIVLASLAAASGAAMQRSDFRFAGKVVRGAAGDKSLYLLVGGEDKTPRQLLALRFASEGPKLVTLAAGLPATADAILAAPASDGGGVLVADGRHVSAFDSSSGSERREVYAGPGLLIAGDDSGRLTAAPPWLAAGSAGEARKLVRAGESLQAGAVQAVPVTASLARWGLHLESPPARFAGPWLAVGPAQEGIHLRTVLLGAGGERQELTSELPEPERVAESAVVTLDGRPTLVVGTFRGLGVMSRKRLRVFALISEPGAPPRRPLLARELSARAWQDLTVRAGDFDGDRRDDLAIAAAEGLGGGDVTVTLFRGMGGGRLYAEPIEASYPVGERDWRFGDVDGDGRPDLVTLGGGTLEVRAAGGSGLPAKKPTLATKLEGTDLPSRRTVEVAVGTRGARTETSREGVAAPTPTPRPAAPASPGKRGAQPAATPAPTPEPPRLPAPRWELLDVNGDRKAELLWWAVDAKGDTHLILLRF